MKIKTEREVLDRLRVKYKAPEHAFLRHVRNATGFSSTTRTIDAMVMSLWPSRGIELQGVEVKVTRGDWLREMKDPEKQEPIFRYCDRFWLVVGDASIVKDGELPRTWGLIVPHAKGLSVKVPAPQLEPAPISREFLAALLRKADDPEKEAEMKDEITRKVRAEMADDLKEVADLRHKVRKLEAEAEVDHRTGVLDAFEDASGIHLSRYGMERVRKVGAMVGAIDDLAPDSFRHVTRQLESALASLDRTAQSVRERLNGLKFPIDLDTPDCTSPKELKGSTP